MFSPKVYCLLLLLHPIYAALQTGDLCKLNNDVEGVCKPLTSCESAKSDLKRNNRPRICSFEGSMPVVCCSDDNKSSSTISSPEESSEMAVIEKDYVNVSLQKCKEYAKLVYLNHSSPTLLPGIEFEIEDTCASKKENYNKSEVLAREFPHLVSIGYDSPLGQVWKCSGALISNQYIITAATCLNLPNLGVAKYVRVGTTNVREPFYHEQPLQYINIKEVIEHPNFNKRNLIHNLAIVKLEEHVNFNSIVRPACLGFSRELPVDAINVGWGTFNMGSLNNEPVKQLLRIDDSQSCDSLKTNQFCVQQITGSLWQNCLADKGSPLQVLNKGHYCTYDIIGLVSDWKYCRSGKPGIYTNISAYIPWIEKIVWA